MRPARIGIEPLGGQPGQRGQVGQRHRTADYGQHVQDRPRGLVGAAGAGGYSLCQAFGQSAQAGRGQVSVLLEQRANQADHIQRVALGTLPDPVDERRGRRLPDDRLGQVAHGGPVQRDHLEPPQEPVLVQFEQRLRRDFLPGRIGAPAGSHDQQRRVVQVPGEVPQRLPRRGIGEVHVVQDGDHRSLACDVPEQGGQPLQQPRQRRLSTGSDPRMTATRWNRLARSSSSPPHAAVTC